MTVPIQPSAKTEIRYQLVAAGVDGEFADSLLHESDNEAMRAKATEMRAISMPPDVTDEKAFWISIVDPDIPVAIPPQT